MRTLAAAIVGLVLISCSPSGTQDGQSTIPGVTAGPPTPSPTPFPTDDAFAQLVTQVAGRGDQTDGALDSLWASILPEALVGDQGQYLSPARVVSYRGGSEVPDSPCAVNTTLRFWANNARYCPADSSIYYDEGWLREFAAKAGDFAPGAILAHEWGHHIQQLAAIDAHQIDEELQADCFAGVFVGSRQHVDNGVFTFSDEELAAGLKALFEIGNRDYSAIDWMSPVEHGSRLQRMMAFGTGWLGASGDFGEFGTLVNGFPWCYGYRDFKPEDYATIGPYRLINIPGRDTSLSGDTYIIASETRTAYTTSEIRLTWLPEAGEIDPVASPEALAPIVGPAVASIMSGVQQLTPISTLPVSAGNAAGYYFERTTETPAGIESGIVELLSPKTGSGGLLISATVAAPAQTTADSAGLAVLFEHLAAITEAANRLCGPGESATAEPPFGSVACSADE